MPQSLYVFRESPSFPRVLLTTSSLQWIIGVVPCLPGFVAAVRPSLTVSDGATEIYYLSYLYGFIASALSLSILHLIFPARRVDEFVRRDTTAQSVQQYYQDHWEVIVGEPSVDTPLDNEYPAERSKEIKSVATAV